MMRSGDRHAVRPQGVPVLEDAHPNFRDGRAHGPGPRTTSGLGPDALASHCGESVASSPRQSVTRSDSTRSQLDPGDLDDRSGGTRRARRDPRRPSGRPHPDRPDPASRGARGPLPPGHYVIGAARAGLTRRRIQRIRRVADPQERHDVLPQEGRTVRPDVAAEVPGPRHDRPPADLAELGVLRLPALVERLGPAEPDQPGADDLDAGRSSRRSGSPAPGRTRPCGDQKTTISRRTARRARDRS